MTDGKKYEPPLFLDMGFDEALKRFGQASKQEVQESIDRSKRKRPSEPQAPTVKHHQRATPSSRRVRRDTDG
jgi:hypothetical protein